nr:MAG TPA: hypothetical protein [Caudoviricetes sp.]
MRRTGIKPLKLLEKSSTLLSAGFQIQALRSLEVLIFMGLNYS